MNTARKSSIGTCDSACSTLRIGMRQKISAKIASVPIYGIALRHSGVARAAGTFSRGAALESGIGPALMRRSSSLRRCP